MLFELFYILSVLFYTSFLIFYIRYFVFPVSQFLKNSENFSLSDLIVFFSQLHNNRRRVSQLSLHHVWNM